jgi:hypothetical protein
VVCGFLWECFGSVLGVGICCVIFIFYFLGAACKVSVLERSVALRGVAGVFYSKRARDLEALGMDC